MRLYLVVGLMLLTEDPIFHQRETSTRTRLREAELHVTCGVPGKTLFISFAEWGYLLMCVPEERVLAISLVREGHLLPQLRLLIITHLRQLLLILFIQAIIIPPQDQDHKTQRTKCSNDANFSRDVARCSISK
jgi:hypothetical protein